MKRYRWALATAGVLLLTGWVLCQIGWLAPSGRDVAPARVQSADPLDSPAGWRYRQSLPHHWRYCVLNNISR